MKKHLLFTSAIALAGFASVANAADYDCSSLGNTNRNDRTLKALNLTDDQGSSLTIDPVQPNTNPQPIYFDKSSDYTFTTVPGATVTVSPTSGASWMHSYVYIDWAGDGFAFSSYSDYMDVVSDTEFALRPGVDLVAFTRWRPTADYPYHDHNGPDASYGGGQNLNEPFSFTIPADAKGGTYRIRYKSAYCQLDPNGVADIFNNNTIQENGGCICDFTLVIEGEEEPVVDYDLSSLGKVHWQIGNNRFLTDITVKSGAGTLMVNPIRGDLQSDLEKRNSVYHDHSDQMLAVEAGNVFHLSVNGGTISANYKNMPTYVYIDWGKDGFIYSTPSDYVDVETSIPHPGSDLVAHNGWSKDGVNGQHRDYNGEDVTSTPDFPYDFEIFVPEDTKPGQYRLRVKNAMCSLDPNGGNDFSGVSIIQNTGGTIVDITIDVKEAGSLPKPVETVLAYNTFNQYLSWTISEFCCEEPTNEQPSGTIDKLIDNDPSTFYHSHWANSDEPHGTHYFVVDLKKARDIHGFAWTPRQAFGSDNGVWRTYHVFASNDKNAFDFGAQLGDKSYSTVTERHTDLEALVDAYVAENADEGRTGNLVGIGGASPETAMFNSPLNGRYVLMVITESNRSLSCAAELGFYFEDTEELRDELNGGGGPSVDDMLAEIQGKLNAYIELIKTYKQSVPFAYLDGALGEVEEIAGMPEFFLEYYDILDQALYAMIGAPVEDVVLNALYDEVDRLWTLYQPGQNGYLCADTKSTNQGYDSFHFQSNADDNSLWTIVPSEFADHFYLRSAKGQYIATPKQHYCRADATIDEAGLFAFGVKDGYVTFESVAFPGCGLGLDGKNDPAEIMTLEDGSLGYRWQVSLTDKPVVVEPQPVAVTVTPAAGVVGYLSNISFFIADADYSINADCADPVTLTSETAVLESLDAEGLANHYDAKAQKYYIDCNLNNNGTYTLTIPEATFKGENIYSKETVVVWTVENSGIVSVTVNGEEVEAYDLQGRRVNNVNKSGLYIINGVKTLVK